MPYPAPTPILLSTVRNATMVEQYEKFELTVRLKATYTNPYDYEQVALLANVYSPTGATLQVAGFYLEEFHLDKTNGQLTPTATGIFQLRFAPTTPGTWTFDLYVRDQLGQSPTQSHSLQVFPATSSNHGFVRSSDTNYLTSDSGHPLILIGENMAWPNANPYLDYCTWLHGLTTNGGNFIRLWHAHWGLGIEWKLGWEHFAGLRQYEQRKAAYQDWLFDYCTEQGVYVMLTLQHHGPVSTKVNPNWQYSPYNVRNGGPCRRPGEFFTHPAAIAHTKNRFRYIVARWGYSRALQSWELFNEVNWVDGFKRQQTAIQRWHAEFAKFLKAIDPQQHLITTSFAEADQDPTVWQQPNIDFTQTHLYLNNSNLERGVASGVRSYLKAYGKPTLTGEFGLSGRAEDSQEDQEGIHFHNSLWAPLFSGGLGTGMSWWWDHYVHPNNLYIHFKAISKVVSQIPFASKNLRPTTARVLGAPGDVVLTPSLGWGSLAESVIDLTSTTVTTSSLSQFLYGSQWNTQYRCPPTFRVHFPAAAYFTLTTGAQLGSGARVTIFLNGQLALDQRARAQVNYQVLVPAGTQEIKVDNSGTDWASIASYRFTGLGSEVDAYVLKGEANNFVAGWLLRHDYNHQYIRKNGAPPAELTDVRVLLDDFVSGSYRARWYHCLTGEAIQSQIIDVGEDAQLSLLLPPFRWDLAFLAERQPSPMEKEIIS